MLLQKIRPRRVRVKNWDGILVIHKGLSAIVHEHLINLDLDEERKVATVKVASVDDVDVDAAKMNDIEEAADLLAKRAERTLGRDWTVKRWGAHKPPPDRTAGDYTAGSGI